MNLTLSWDLFIIVFFALVVTYSLIIGKKESTKIILASYIAIVAVQGVGNFAERMLGFDNMQSLFSSVGIPLDATATSIMKLVLFITIVVFLAVRAGLHVQYGHDNSVVTNVAMTVLSGFATAGLLLATLLTFIAGAPLLDMQITTTPGLDAILKDSTLMTLMIQNLDLWFTLPAGVLIATGFFSDQ
ncbi:hypothetical protein EXS70_04490 [Candidatus Peribacteria bacterium]|nr:hypothetical protein [Candidatus Peribacteria bacterium]